METRTEDGGLTISLRFVPAALSAPGVTVPLRALARPPAGRSSPQPPQELVTGNRIYQMVGSVVPLQLLRHPGCDDSF